MKRIIIRWYYNIVYDAAYSLWFCVKEFVIDVWHWVLELKKPKTWLFILYAVALYSIYRKDFVLLGRLAPLIITVYWIRQRWDGKYRNEIYKRALTKDNDIILQEYYEDYKKRCYFSKKEPFSYERWKEEEKEINSI